MQKKQLRTLAIIALIAIFVIGSIMRLTIEPADLGKGSGQDGTQVVENLPAGDNQADGVLDDVADGTDDDNAEDDGNADNKAENEKNDGKADDVSGDKPSGVSGAEKEEQGKQPATVDKDDAAKNDNTADNGVKDDTANITDDSAATKPDSSAETGKKPGAWPPIPEQAVADPDNPQTYSCTMEIYCTTLLNEENIDNEAIIPYIPEDGVILPKTTIQFTEGENAFDVILRACRANDIQFEFREDSLYSGAYVEGINYLYEMDGGPLSGWMYKVNGQFPNYGCKRYIVQDGDAIVWMYTCDLGRDVGDNSVW